MNNIKYRSDIDGLRAISVFAVIIYHANINLAGNLLLPGGFIGVDVFFVISGFLISKIIFDEADKESFSFINFYERRIRRLLPVLFLVCISTMILGWFILLPDYYISSSKSLISGILFFSNIYFYFSGLEYDAQAAIYQPFLHLWSLSVEEQFYIIFPFLIIILFKIRKQIVILFLFILFIISLLVAEYVSLINPSFAFYFIITRAFELSAGSIIAYLEYKKIKIKSDIINSILVKIGFILIIISFFLFNEDLRHPSFITLIPVLGTASIIYCNRNKDLIYKSLSLKPIVAMGLISYSMYLWHYPIFVFNRLTNLTSGRIEFELMLGLGIVIFSYMSYKFVERPFRNRNFLSTKNIYILSIITAFFIIIFSLSIIEKEGFKNRVPKILENHYSTSLGLSELTTQNSNMCLNRKTDFCHFIPLNTNNKKIFILGDSHLANIQEDLKNKLTNKNYEVIIMTEGGCIYAPETNVFKGGSDKKDKNCNNSYQLIKRNELLNNKGSTIIIGGRYPLYFSEKFFNNKEGGIEGGNRNKYFTNLNNTLTNKSERNIFLKSKIREGIQELLDNDFKILIIYPIPEVGWHVPRQIWREAPRNENKFLSWINNNKITTSYDVFKSRSKETYEFFDAIKHKNILRVYPENIFCNNIELNRCETHTNEKIYYRDDDHLSYEGGALLNKYIVDQISFQNQ